MTALTTAAADSATMLRRNIRHMQRYPSLTLMLIGMPIVFLLLFVYVLGGTMGAGLGGAGGGRADYLAYVVPGILVIALAAAAQGTAISVAMDMTEGIIDRFRTMAISRAAVLTGHVVGALIQTAICTAVVLAVAVAMGFRPHAGVVSWLGVIGMLALIALALTWLTVALGLGAKSVETASNSPMPLLLLPFFGSGFVPANTLPGGLRWFAQHQPFTPMTETIRALLTGTHVGDNAVMAVIWCVAIGLFGYMKSRRSYDRLAVRQ
jgi:ABC-2 type transport system permease protein